MSGMSDDGFRLLMLAVVLLSWIGAVFSATSFRAFLPAFFSMMFAMAWAAFVDAT